MKNTLATLLLLATLGCTHAQKPEFGQDSLLYSPQTMQQLKHIVDSLNLKFKSCELPRTYYALPQTRGHYVAIEGARAQAAAKLLDDQPSWATFEQAFPDAEVQRDLLILRNIEEDYNNQEYVSIRAIPIGDRWAPSIGIYDLAAGNAPQLQGKWLFAYDGASGSSKASFEAFYFETNFVSQPLNERYARMVQYVDCMVDTSTVIFTAEAEYGYMREAIGDLDTMTMAQKQALLQKMRGTMVMGQCSMDDSPRRHARNIAILAAESVSWEVFLRAHLDIMNDHFSRASDGSYAWAQRMTYLHELEVLDINTLELILGMSFRIDNPSANHYYGSIGRLGRAIAEAENVAAIEKQVLGMIQDPTLDDFNRVIMHNLFISYIYQDKNVERRTQNIERFKTACAQLPAYLAKHVKVDEIKDED